MKKTVLYILFVIVACLGLTGTAPAVAAPAPDHATHHAQKIADPGSDCWGWATAAKQSNGTVNLHWEIYCSQQYYPLINLEPRLNVGGQQYNFEKQCRSNNGYNDCVFNKNLANPAGKQLWWVTWDPAWGGSGVYFGSGEKRCNVPSGIYCSDTQVNW
jgi:hypothetical protein